MDSEEVDIIESISIEDLPAVISESFENVKYIDKCIQETRVKSEESLKLAKSQKAVKGLGVFSKEALESTQVAVKTLAETQIVLVDTQKELFFAQQKMAECMKYLFALGVSNLSMTRIVIAELESKLKQAENEELSQTARDELLDVVRRLRRQESIFIKLDEQDKDIKNASKKIIEQNKVIRKLKFFAMLGIVGGLIAIGLSILAIFH